VETPLESPWSSTSRRPPDLRRRNLREEVVRYIRDLILGGEIKPGMRIDQDAIAADVGVSRLPVREALILLEAEGLVESRPRRGTYVAEFTEEDLVDQYRAFGVIAGMIAARAAERMTQDDVLSLQEALERAEAAKTTEEQAGQDARFHEILMRNGGSLRLQGIYRSFSYVLPTRGHHLDPKERARATRAHREQLEALRSGDADRAAEAVRRHVEDSAAYAGRLLRSTGFWGTGGRPIRLPPALRARGPVPE
jgi:DNA-binding GntR family transcriptional regulator